jgi:hypothetical protein
MGSDKSSSRANVIHLHDLSQGGKYNHPHPRARQVDQRGRYPVFSELDQDAG